MIKLSSSLSRSTQGNGHNTYLSRHGAYRTWMTARIRATDKAFETRDCGTWTKIG